MMLNLSKSGASSPVKNNASLDKSGNYGYSTQSKFTNSSLGPKVINLTLVRGGTTLGRDTQKDIERAKATIYHEDKMYKSLNSRAGNAMNLCPKRDPILQNNGEENVERRPRNLISQERSGRPKSRDELIVRQKKIGEFNEIFNPRNPDPKPQGIKAFKIYPSECIDEKPKRVLKAVRSQSLGHRNPILDGEERLFKRIRGTGLTSHEDIRKLNDKKFLLPIDRGHSSPYRKLFNQSSFTLNDSYDSSPVTYVPKRRASTPHQRSLSALQNRMRGSAKGILEYEDGPKFRQEKVAEKVGVIKFQDILNSTDGGSVFGRVSTLGR